MHTRLKHDAAYMEAVRFLEAVSRKDLAEMPLHTLLGQVYRAMMFALDRYDEARSREHKRLHPLEEEVNLGK